MPVSIHEHPEEWLATALADGLSAEERRALDGHLAGCEQCRTLQADLAELDTTLLRDFPLAVGPDGGFETRLVAGFRRRRGRGERWAKLRALLGWLLRQRGVQFAGVAAALIGLVGLGKVLTQHSALGPPVVVGDAHIIDGVIDQSAIQNNMDGSALVDREKLGLAFREQRIDGRHSLAATTDAKDKRASYDDSPEIFLGSVPVPGINTGRDIYASYGESSIPVIDGVPGSISLGNGKSSVTGPLDSDSSRSRAPLTLSGANTFTGGSSTLGGTVAVNGGATITPRNDPKFVDFPRITRPPSDSRIVVTGANIPTAAEAGTARVDTVDQAARDRMGRQDTLSVMQRADPSFSGGGSLPQSNPSKPVEPPKRLESTTTPTASEVGAPAVEPAVEPAAVAPTTDVRKLIRNATADLEVASFDAAVDSVTAAAARNGGFLDTRDSTRGDNGKVSGTLVYKVQPDHLDRFLAALRPLGTLENQTIQTQDVTKDYFDTDARLRNSRRMEDRLLKMLAEVKGKMSEVLQVEKEIGRVRADIETMQGQLKLYDAQVRYATVTLEVHEKDLGQPVSFLLNETATLSLLVADVEKTAAEARRIADAAHAQVLRSDASRDASGHARATLNLLVAPEAASEVIAQVKALGRVENFHVQDERTAKNGDASEAKGEDSAKVERGPVAFDITISHDEQISRQISFTLVAPDVESVFEKARASAVAAGGEIVNANVAHAPNGHASATLGVRVPPAAESSLTTLLKTFGRAGNVETRRVGTGPDAGSGPVFISLNVVDQEPAVQQTSVRVQTGDVEKRADEIKREAAANHVDVETSSFASEGNGRQRAGLRFRLPMSSYGGFIERIRGLGAVKDFAVQREDRPETSTQGSDANAPAIIELTLYNEGSVISTDAGLGATFRRTFGQGAGALTWSIQMIGVAVAFLAPWVVLLAMAWWGMRWYRRRKERQRFRREAATK